MKIDFEKELADNMPVIISAFMTKNFSGVIEIGSRIADKYMRANQIQPLGAQAPQKIAAQIANLNATQEAFLTFFLDYFSKKGKL